MAGQFSTDGKYFAQISLDGKLKIWNTLSNSFVQEFIPNIQLTSSCTCLHFISSNSENKPSSPRKKKRRESPKEFTTFIVLGTSSGRLLVYSLTKGDLDYVIDSTTSQSVNCLSANNDQLIYSGIDSNILVWDLYKRNISTKWAAGNETINAILFIPNSERLLTASRNIKLWNPYSKEVLKTYTGHSSQITLLHYVSSKNFGTDSYIISGSKGDRLLNCWNLNENMYEKNAVASFLMEDIVHNLSVFVDQDSSTYMAATVRSGVVHVYKHTLNGKCTKPVKPRTTVQVVSDSSEHISVSPIHITAATFRDEQTLCICYGNAVVQTFENITLSEYQKLHCLLRKRLDNKATLSKENEVSKIRVPVVGNDVHYLTSLTYKSITTKRKNDSQQEVPMEKRLENLMVNELDSDLKVPKANNVAQLLVQGLHSKDRNILKTALFKKDDELIQNTVKRLPFSVIVPLFEELTKLIQGKTLSRRIGLMWLKSVILVHSALFLSNPDLPKLFGEALGSIEAGIALQIPRNKLIGRLELLISQINKTSIVESKTNSEALLTFNDKVSSDSETDGVEFEVHSSSNNDWEEESTDGQENNENEKVYESDNDNNFEESML